MYYRKKEDTKRLKKIYSKTNSYYGRGVYYSNNKKRYIRYKVFPSYYTFLKKIANKKIRHQNNELSNGNNYKKIIDIFWLWC